MVATKRKNAGPKRTKASAKQQKPAVNQQQFETDGFPEKPPAAVRKARDLYLQAKRDSADAATEKSQAEQKLIDEMTKNGIQRLKLDGESKYFEIEAQPKVKMKTFPKKHREESGGE